MGCVIESATQEYCDKSLICREIKLCTVVEVKVIVFNKHSPYKITILLGFLKFSRYVNF